MKELRFESEIQVPLNTIINYQFGIYVNNSFEYLDYGNYIVFESKFNVDTGYYEHICYDKMLYSMKEYKQLQHGEFPMTVRNFIKNLCLDLSLTFADSNSTFANYNKVIESDLYKDLGYTYRDIFDELSAVTGSIICLKNNDQVEIRYINETDDTITSDFLKDTNITIEEHYGPINSIVLSRSAESDNVFIQDEQSIVTNGLCEIKIKDNQIMNFNNRSDYLPDLLEKLGGLNYYVVDLNTIGIGYYEVFDKYNLQINENTYNCILFNSEFVNSMGINEQIYSEKLEESQTDYSKSDKTDRKIKQAYLIVDKQNQKIEALVSTINGSVKSVQVQYALSTSSTTAPSSGWSTTAPTWQDGKYMWQRTITTYADNTTSTSNPTNITGAKGQQGQDGQPGATGKGVSALKPQYYLSTSNTSQTGGSWVDTPPTYNYDEENPKYYWTRTMITWTDNTTTYTTPVLANDTNSANKKISELNISLDGITGRVEANEQGIAEIKTTTDTVEGNNTLTTQEAVETNALEYHVEGNSYQETTTGKNKFIWDTSDYSSTSNGLTFTWNAKEQTVTVNGTCTTDNTVFSKRGVDNLITPTKDVTTLSAHYISGSITNANLTLLQILNGSTWVNKSIYLNNLSSSQPILSTVWTSDSIFNGVRIYSNSGTVFNNFKIKIMLANSSNTTYEPYTGGNPQPNPDYPSEIETIKPYTNLFDKDNATIIRAYTQGSTNKIVSANEGRLTYIPCKPNTTYTAQKISSKMFSLSYSTNEPVINGTFEGRVIGNTSTHLSITTGANANYLIFEYFNADTISEQQILDSMQIEYGTIVHPYIPYGKWYEEVKITGKNLFNDTFELGTISASTGNNSSSTANIRTKNYTELEGNTEYTIKSYIDCNIAIRFYDKDKNFISADSTKASPNTFTTTQKTKYARFILANQLDTTVKVQLEEGNQSTSYEPYKEQSALIDMTNPNLQTSELELGSISGSTGAVAASNDCVRTKDFISVKPNTTYTVLNDMNYRNVLHFYAEDKSVSQSYTSEFGNPKFFTTGDNTCYIKIRSAAGNIENDLNVKYYLYEGTNADPYYELAKITEKDTLDIDDNTIINQKIGKHVFTGNENWQSTGSYAWLVLGNNKLSTPVLSNYFKQGNSSTPETIWCGNNLAITYGSNITNLTTLKSFLQTQYNNGTPVTVYYELATPQTIQLPNTNIPLFEGINHVTLIDDLETNTSIKYLLKTPLSDTYQTHTESKAELNIFKDEIMLGVSETYETKDEVNTKLGKIDITTSDITSLVEDNYKAANKQFGDLNEKFDEYALSGDLIEVNKSVKKLQTSTYTKTEVNTKLSDGSVTKVSTTSGTFDKDGLHIAKSGEEMESLLSNTGLYVNRTSTNILTADNTGVTAENLHSRRYLSVGGHCRWEDFEDGVGAFYVE